LWSRQIPYTMAKFYFFEKTVEMFYDYVFTAPKETYGKVCGLIFQCISPVNYSKLIVK